MAESATSVGSLTFLGLFAMFSLSPRLPFTRPGEYCANAARKLEAESHAPPWRQKRDASAPWPQKRDASAPWPQKRDASAGLSHPETSYWLGGANEMAAINTILIIVNSPAP